MNRVICRGLANSAARMETAPKGKYQHWRKPVYSAPHVNPLEVGADFSFNDTRNIQFTSRTQVDNKLEQLRLAKQITVALQQIREIEATHAFGNKQRAQLTEETQRWMPISKSKETLH